VPDPCETCGHTPEPSPEDWLDADELALVAFLTARLSEHREAVEPHTSGPARPIAITAADLAASALALPHGFAWTREPERRAVLRLPLLLLTQPWAEHPDHQWLPELRERLR